MNVTSSPLHCTLVFDFSVNERNFMVSLYQDLTTDEKIVKVLNPDGTTVEDEKICDYIVKYAIEKYSITYDPGNDTQEDIKSDSVI